jgi:DNA-binding FrmR family transcriptional regulator
MTQPHRHMTHPLIVKRLRRAGGHLAAVIQMIESELPCLDIATQLQAVESAIAQAKRTLVQDHLDHCLDAVMADLPEDKRQPFDEFKAISKYL